MSLVILTACGRENVIYSADPNAIVRLDDFYLPTGFNNQSVNQGDVTFKNAPTKAVVILYLNAGASPAGSFNNAAATGNRSIISIENYDETALSDFTLQLTTTDVSANAKLGVSLLVDLTCDAATPGRTLESQPLTNGASLHDAIWSVAGAAITNAAGQTILSSSADSAPKKLDDVLAEYPNACLRGAVSDAPGLPKSKMLGSLNITLGDENSIDEQSVTITDMTINGDLYSKWGDR